MSDATPTFSVVMPCYNAARRIEDAIRCVQAQTFEDWRLWVVDDASTDDTAAIVGRFAEADPRIRLVKLSRNRGASAARNYGAFSHATGAYVAFLDADDVWSPDRLAVFDALFRRAPSITALYSRVAFVGEADGARNVASAISIDPLALCDVLGDNPVCTMSNLVVRADAYARVGGLDEQLTHTEDLDLLMRMILDGAVICGVDRVLASYRLGSTGLSSDLGAMYDGWRRAVGNALADGAISARDYRRAEAIQRRYLARRALRIGAAPGLAARHALRGVVADPCAFFNRPKHAMATVACAMAAAVLPSALAARWFA